MSKILIDKSVISKGWKTMGVALIDAEMMVICILVTKNTMTNTKAVGDKSWDRTIQVATVKKGLIYRIKFNLFKIDSISEAEYFCVKGGPFLNY